MVKFSQAAEHAKNKQTKNVFKMFFYIRFLLGISLNLRAHDIFHKKKIFFLK